MWDRIKQRRKDLAEVRRYRDLSILRMAACDRELAKCGEKITPSYVIMWKQKLEYYQDLMIVQKALVGRDNWLFILTGRRWLWRLWKKNQ